jgi:arginine decarboxylase
MGSQQQQQQQQCHLHLGGPCIDPLRLTLSVSGLGITGHRAAALLESRHGVVCELATPACVVLALGMGSRVEDSHKLAHGLDQLLQASPTGPAIAAHRGGLQEGGRPLQQAEAGAASITAQPLPPMQLSPREAFFAATEVVPAAAAVGRVCAELLCVYPPGIPALVPGEVIGSQSLQLLQEALVCGGRVTGGCDPSLHHLKVVR